MKMKGKKGILLTLLCAGMVVMMVSCSNGDDDSSSSPGTPQNDTQEIALTVGQRTDITLAVGATKNVTLPNDCTGFSVSDERNAAGEMVEDSSIVNVTLATPSSARKYVLTGVQAGTVLITFSMGTSRTARSRGGPSDGLPVAGLNPDGQGTEADSTDGQEVASCFVTVSGN